MTLKNCVTVTKSYIIKGGNQFEVFYDGKELQNNNFKKKVIRFLSFLKHRYSFTHDLRVDTINSFPTASGVASSASGFAALTIAAIAAWTESESFADLEEKGFTREILANLSRLGSGSSCRSFYDGFVLWERGDSSEKQMIKSLYSHEHWKLSNTLVVLSDKEKSLSSSDAHSRVWSSPLFKTRLAQMDERQELFEGFIKKKDLKGLGLLLEQEALDIHNILMTSGRPHNYLTQETQDFLVWLRNLRREKSFEAYFTIDAGANVHVITKKIKQKAFLAYLKEDYPQVPHIEDTVGSGPELSCENFPQKKTVMKRTAHEKRPSA